MTKKSSSGALHTTFCSSSSSSEHESTSESESSSSESSEPEELEAVVNKIQGNKTTADKSTSENHGRLAHQLQVPSNSLKTAPLAGGSPSSPVLAKGGNRQAMNAKSNRRGGRNRKRTLSSNLTVGGRHDVLTTKSTLYKSPINARQTSASSGTNHQLFNGDSGSGSGVKNSGSGLDRTKKSTTGTEVGGKETEKPTSQWDVRPEAPVVETSHPGAASLSVKASPQELAVQPPRDYSTLPDFLGAPRVGDKLAFKVRSSIYTTLVFGHSVTVCVMLQVLELSSSYTPVVSEYKVGK